MNIYLGVPKIDATVAAIKNATKIMVIMPVVRGKASKPNRERNITGLQYNCSLTTRKVGFLSKGRKGECMDEHTTRQLHALMTSVSEYNFLQHSKLRDVYVQRIRSVSIGKDKI